MKTFALIDENNIVANVALFDDKNTPTDLGWSGWYETGEGMRKNIAGPGSTFVPEAEGYPSGLFYSPSPFPSWQLDGNHDWQPPTPRPDGDFYWDEDNRQWVEIEIPEA